MLYMMIILIWIFGFCPSKGESVFPYMSVNCRVAGREGGEGSDPLSSLVVDLMLAGKLDEHMKPELHVMGLIDFGFTY